MFPLYQIVHVKQSFSVVWTTVSCTTSRWRTKLVDIIQPTIDDLDIIWPMATIATMIETHFTRDLSFRDCWMGTVHPTSVITLTSMLRYTWCCNFNPSTSSKSVPSCRKAVVAEIACCFVFLVSVAFSQPVVLKTFFIMWNN